MNTDWAVWIIVGATVVGLGVFMFSSSRPTADQAFGCNWNQMERGECR